jgi:hypothetical protein
MVPTEIAERLVQNSYEDVITRVAEAIEREIDRFLAEDQRGSESAQSIATFKTHAIVATTAGDFYRVEYQLTKAGVQFKLVEKIDVPVLDDEGVKKYVENEIDNVLDDFFENKNRAFSRLEEVVRSVDMSRRDPLKSARALADHVKGADWRKQINEEHAGLRNLIQLDSISVERRFSNLYSESADEKTFAGFVGPLSESLSGVFSKVESLLGAASRSYASYKSKRRVPTAESEKGVLAKFDAFAESFLTETRRMLREARNLVNTGECVPCWALVHDSFADALDDVQIASAMVSYFSDQLKTE